MFPSDLLGRLMAPITERQVVSRRDRHRHGRGEGHREKGRRPDDPRGKRKPCNTRDVWTFLAPVGQRIYALEKRNNLVGLHLFKRWNIKGFQAVTFPPPANFFWAVALLFRPKKFSRSTIHTDRAQRSEQSERRPAARGMTTRLWAVSVGVKHEAGLLMRRSDSFGAAGIATEHPPKRPAAEPVLAGATKKPAVLARL